MVRTSHFCLSLPLDPVPSSAIQLYIKIVSRFFCEFDGTYIIFITYFFIVLVTFSYLRKLCFHIKKYLFYLFYQLHFLHIKYVFFLVLFRYEDHIFMIRFPYKLLFLRTTIDVAFYALNFMNISRVEAEIDSFSSKQRRLALLLPSVPYWTEGGILGASRHHIARKNTSQFLFSWLFALCIGTDSLFLVLMINQGFIDIAWYIKLMNVTES